MSAEDLFTLARLDYELHAGAWPLGRDVAERYIGIAHPGEPLDRHLLVDVLGEYIGSFARVSDLARTLTAQSFLGSAEVDLTTWPFRHIDWHEAGVALEESIAEDELGPIMRINGMHFFTPTPRD